MTDEERFDPNRWHFSKSIPISIVFFLLFQTIVFVIWQTRRDTMTDARLDALERSQTVQDARLAILENVRDKILILEERQNNVLKILETNAKKIDTLVDEYTRIRK